MSIRDADRLLKPLSPAQLAVVRTSLLTPRQKADFERGPIYFLLGAVANATPLVVETILEVERRVNRASSLYNVGGRTVKVQPSTSQHPLILLAQFMVLALAHPKTTTRVAADMAARWGGRIFTRSQSTAQKWAPIAAALPPPPKPPPLPGGISPPTLPPIPSPGQLIDNLSIPKFTLPTITWPFGNVSAGGNGATTAGGQAGSGPIDQETAAAAEDSEMTAAQYAQLAIFGMMIANAALPMILAIMDNMKPKEPAAAARAADHAAAQQKVNEARSVLTQEEQNRAAQESNQLQKVEKPRWVKPIAIGGGILGALGLGRYLWRRWRT